MKEFLRKQFKSWGQELSSSDHEGVSETQQHSIGVPGTAATISRVCRRWCIVGYRLIYMFNNLFQIFILVAVKLECGL